MRSPARARAAPQVLYRQAIEDARVVESLGFDSMWLAEHRFWYDGWCPQPVLVAAALAAATTRLHIGTAVHLLGQHPPARAALTAATVARLFAGRLELGVGLGYRPEEFAGIGNEARERVALLNAGLDALESSSCPPRVWLGGMADAAVVRAARRGVSLMLPPGISAAKAKRLIELARAEATASGTTIPRIAIIKDVWVGGDGDAARRLAGERFTSHYREYASAWWGRDASGQVDHGRVGKQVAHALANLIAGTPREVLVELDAYADAGVDSYILQVHTEETRDLYLEQLGLIAAEILPRLREAN
jgi:alkanesulfonate monooxygenase SsuD/methylene tetrahydromethanopterin reductase-like flavin-dependent oxidoreductase (luciferase family)